MSEEPKQSSDDAAVPKDEPLAEWERDILAEDYGPPDDDGTSGVREPRRPQPGNDDAAAEQDHGR